MNYELDQPLLFVPDSKFDKQTLVKVVGLRKGGSAKLSNGWLVDSMGVAEGTNRIPGGRVEEVEI
jgi:hypothetical protein